MFSIIICSIDSANFEKLSKSISCTIGEVDFELIRIDNRVLNLSIAEAYNNGIDKSKYPFLVLVHEDVIFHTNGWGEKLLEGFKNPKVGLIGIAGSRIKANIPSGWWNNSSEHLYMNIIQHPKIGKKQLIQFGFGNENFSEVVVLDGVFMAARKTEQIRFDETLKGFHNYDQSFSLSYRKYDYKVMVTNQILLEHFSEGNKNKDWVKSLLAFHKKYRTCLPQTVGNYKIERKDKAHSCLRLIYNCKNNHMRSMAFRYWLQYLSMRPLDRRNIQMLKYFLFLN
ncbi:glycosyltransferase [Christiangramia aquimixticola]|uniref:glycosyltransferase n=1 Tax=Christiangramia aquimixticola TaxID=1697558 RepID=UPI003AA81113